MSAEVPGCRRSDYPSLRLLSFFVSAVTGSLAANGNAARWEVFQYEIPDR
ncbi:hypothetical protein CKO_00696 [Citrobacter koseri ATCC BAA-895]|uniref:Uncharacterized protein n=1 Tax=Citrobacter koseri (strain ATCC BAA-895 / CDC 4225-83 / SGSC4696) TaxID=290338 RepID=A8AED7_CITK8|nr:hypothetical protein CKO_00696 [Citrobacter koseri ATCC BAA-895]